MFGFGLENVRFSSLAITHTEAMKSEWRIDVTRDMFLHTDFYDMSSPHAIN